MLSVQNINQNLLKLSNKMKIFYSQNKCFKNIFRQTPATSQQVRDLQARAALRTEEWLFSVKLSQSLGPKHQSTSCTLPRPSQL